MGARSDKVCPLCGTRYTDLRTGLMFAEVKQMLWVDSDDTKLWRYRRRHTVLGLWHALKLDMWEEHLDYCYNAKEAA